MSRLVRIFVAVALIAGATIGAGVRPAAAGQVTFSTPGSFDFTVPDDVTSIAVVAEGASGGGIGGGGGRVTAPSVSVLPGEQLKVFVGGAGGFGSGGFNGGGDGDDGGGGAVGGGGGASDVRRAPYTPLDRLVVAGGGGGGNFFGFGGFGGQGGGSGTDGFNGSNGAGGGKAGGAFGDGGAGSGGGGDGEDQSLGRGGEGGDANGGCCISPGGSGGGGGAIGGGGGGGDGTCCDAGAGGGGGSSSGPAGSTFGTGVRFGDGVVTINFDVTPDAQIRKAGQPAFTGDDVCCSADDQRVSTRVKKGRTVKFDILIENDGTADESFTVSGTPGSRRFRAAYFDGPTDVTADVVAGTYTTPVLMPGGTHMLTLHVKVRNSAVPGTKRAFVIAASSGALTDAVMAVVRVRA